MKNNDLVNHPLHYNWHPSGVECATIAEAFNYNLGNALKYIWRCDHKGQPVEDLKKAVVYLNREIDRRVDECNTTNWSVRAEKPAESPSYRDARRQVELGHDYYHGRNGRTQNYETAVEWWKLAAAQGDAEAQWLLGNAYLFGRGVEKDKEEADRLWKLAEQNRKAKPADLVTKSASLPNLTGSANE